MTEKAALGEFRAKRAQWICWLRGDDRHSVWNQIYNMMWNDMVFRVHVNECRKSDEDPPQPRSSFNGPLGRLLDQGYIATQVLSIRRLVEREASKDDRQPISIGRVLRDIRQHRHLFTRENYVGYDGLPYDYAAKQQEWYDENATDMMAGKSFPSMEVRGPEAWTLSELLHENFDRISGVDAEDRDRADLISIDVFDQISNVFALQEIRDVAVFADKFVAHAADPLARAAVSDEEMAISMDKLATCHAALISATKMISEQCPSSDKLRHPAVWFSV